MTDGNGTDNGIQSPHAPLPGALIGLPLPPDPEQPIANGARLGETGRDWSRGCRPVVSGLDSFAHLKAGKGVFLPPQFSAGPNSTSARAVIRHKRLLDSPVHVHKGAPSHQNIVSTSASTCPAGRKGTQERFHRCVACKQFGITESSTDCNCAKAPKTTAPPRCGGSAIGSEVMMTR